jgi:hypothetical protein
MASIAPQASNRFPDGHKVRYRHPNGSAGALTFPDRRSAEKFVKLIDALGVADALERVGRAAPQTVAMTSPTVAATLERYAATRAITGHREQVPDHCAAHHQPRAG